MAKLLLEIFTPYKKYLSKEVDEVVVFSNEHSFGITYSHSPMISDVSISHLTVVNDGEKDYFAIGGGLLKVEKVGHLILLLDSIESEDEIDTHRAYLAKERAEKRLKELQNKNDIDVARAKLALARAINRVRLVNKNEIK